MGARNPHVIVVSLMILLLGLGTSLAADRHPSLDATGPILAPDTLTPAERAAMEAEIAEVRAAVEHYGLSWIPGETGMMRLSPEERLHRRQSILPPIPQPGVLTQFEMEGYAAPRDGYLDWRDNGGNFVTGVRSQGDCGSCWDFGATAALESAFLVEIGAGNLPDFDLSEQHVLQCMSDYGFSSSCNGGWDTDVYWFACNVGMIEECCLPYTGNDATPCGHGACADMADRTYDFNSYGTVCYGANPSAIMSALETYGPLSTSMTTYPSFDTYTGGIYEVIPGEQPDGGHNVEIVGYDETGQFWIIKNSWGDDWGMAGFGYVSWYSGTGLGNYTRYTTFDATGMGPYACFDVESNRPFANEPCRFWDRSVAVSGEIVSWEWDFDGDGSIDATGPGPHDFYFTDSGTVTPWLRVTDIDGQEDVHNPIGALEVIWDGPAWHVDADLGSLDGDGSPSRPLLRIQNGLNVADPGDTVVVHAGTYAGVLNTELRCYGKGILVLGQGAQGDAVIDGEVYNRIWNFDSGEGPDCQIQNLTMINGYHDFQGAAAFLSGSSPSFVDCVFEDCLLDDVTGVGGAAVWSDGSPSFIGCSFAGNAATGSGGAIYNEGALLTLSGCSFDGNSSTVSGGAVSVAGGDLDVEGCTFTGNQTVENGGGLHVSSAGTVDVGSTLFDGNMATSTTGLAGGGAISLTGASTFGLVNSIFDGNSGGFGGAIMNSGATAQILHCSSYGNQGLIVGGFLTQMSGTGEIGNSILWGDSGGTNPEIMTVGALTVRYSLVDGGWDGGEAILDEDPLYEDAPMGNFHLADGSPCLNYGDDYGVLVDFFGNERPAPEGTLPDIGACEEGGTGTAVDEPQALAFRFEGIYPNPFNPATTIAFHLFQAADVSVDVFLPTGQKVATALSAYLGEGSHQVSWTAVSELGEPLASGLYLVKLEADYGDGQRDVEMRKAILVK